MQHDVAVAGEHWEGGGGGGGAAEGSGGNLSLYAAARAGDCLALLRWLGAKAGQHPVLTRSLAAALLHTHSGSPASSQGATTSWQAAGVGAAAGGVPFAAWALRVHSLLPENLQKALEDVLHNLLVVYEFKAQFACAYSELYLELLERRLTEEFANDAREKRRDVFVFSVQLFTVPSLARALVTDNRYGQLRRLRRALQHTTSPGCVSSLNAAGLLDGMLQWLLHHFTNSSPARGGVRPRDLVTSDDEPVPALDECVDMRTQMLDKDTNAWRRMIIDMRYLLRHTCVTSTLIAPPGSKAGSPAASMPAAAVPASSGQPLPFRTMLRVLRRFQLTDPVVRQRGEHVRYESKLWQRAVPAVRLIFEMFLMSLSFLQAPDQDAGKRQGAASHRTAAGSGREGYVEGGGLQAAAAGGHGEGSAVAGGMAGVDGCVEVQTCVRAVRECVDELQSWFRARGVRHLEETEWEGRVCFRVSKHPTSFHLPLHRALAQLLAIAMKSAPQENSAPTSLALALRVLRSRKGFARCLFEHPLRAQVLSVQVDCLVWVRNGFQLQNHASIYTAQRFRGRDLDMLTLQTAMALATPRDAEHIVPLIVDGFELGQLVRLDCVSPPFVGEVPHHMTNLPIPPWRDQRTSLDDLGVGTPQQQIMCGEEMLRRLITLLSAREYAGDMSPMRRWRMCLIHCLALQDRVHSDIVEWAETCPAACGNEDLLAQVVDLILPEIATRVSASAAKTGLASEVYRLRDACWSEVDVHSLCVRTRKEQHDLEERLYKHAKAHPELYTRTSVSGKAGVARVPWLACHPVPFRRELRGGLANIAQSSSLFRLVFVMLHNAARAFDTVGSAGGPVQGMAAGIVGGMGWEGEPVLTRSSEMLVRQCVHLLFLALDLRQGTGVDASNATGASDVEMSDSHTPGRRAGAASHVGAYYESPPVTCEEEASDMVEAMDLVTDVVQPAQGGGDVEAHVPELYIAEASLNMPLDAKAPRAVDANATGLENFLVYGGGGGGGSPTVPGGGDAAMGGGHTDGLGVRASVLDQLCHSYLINGDGGFEDGEGTRVSHSSVHAVSHRASILSLLARLVKRLPKADDLLAQEGVEMFLAEVASVQHDGCAQALAASGYELLGLQEQGDAEERARMKKMAADRQAQMMAQMKMQQAAAAAHMMLEDDDDEHHAASASKERGDALAQLEGSNCALCQESMEMSGVKWSRWDPANESWVDYSGETSAELERASELFEAGEGDNRVQVLLHGDTYVVDVDRMRQTGPVDEGGVRPGRETRCKVRRIVNETMLLGFSQRSPFATCSASADHGGEVKTRHALVVTLCGHAMHKTCLNRYISLLVARRHHITHGSTFEQAHSIDFDQGEFVCAICRRVANTALPVCRMPALTPAPNSDSRTWHWTDAIGGDAGDDEEGWANMFGWVMCDGGGNPPLCTEGPHGSFWLAMSRADDTGRWTRSQPQSRIASRHETAQPPREGAEKIARLVADQVASLELSSRGRLLDVEDARSRPADDILSPTALLLSTLRHQMAAAVFWGDPPLSPDDEAGRRPPACPPWRVSTSWSWLQAQSRAPQVWVEGGCVLGSSKEDEAEEEEMSEDDQEEFAVANVHRGLAALQAHLRGEEEEEEEEAEAEVIPLVRVRTAQPAREEETMQLLPRNGWNGHDTPGLSVSGGACLLTCDLFLLFTSLLAHQPPNSGDRLMGESDQGGACDAPSAGGSGGEGRGGGGELPMARLVRVLYTAHVTQILVALYDQFLAEARDGAERGEAGAGAAHAADDDATMGDSEGPGAGARGAGGWGLQDMLQRIAEAYLERGRPCSLACLAGMLDRQAAVACGGGAAGAVAGGGGGGLSGDTAPAMRVAQWVCRASLPFLRRVALLLHLTGTSLPTPPPGHPLAGAEYSARAAVSWDKEYLSLCARLGLPTLLPPLPNAAAPAAPYYAPVAGLAASGEMGMAGGALWKMLEAWLAHLVQARVQGLPMWSDRSESSWWRHEPVGGGQAVELPCLIQLPLVFQDLVNKYAELAQESQESSVGQLLRRRDSAAVCLACGQCVWYLSRNMDARRSDGCCAHADKCGGGQGLFLSLLDTVVYLVQGEWISKWGSPYLDSHGEEDIGLGRGAKLCLDTARWNKLEELWRTHHLRACRPDTWVQQRL